MVGFTSAGSRWCALVLPVVVAGDWLRLGLRIYGPAIAGQGSVGLPSLRASGGPAGASAEASVGRRSWCGVRWWLPAVVGARICHQSRHLPMTSSRWGLPSLWVSVAGGAGRRGGLCGSAGQLNLPSLSWVSGWIVWRVSVAGGAGSAGRDNSEGASGDRAAVSMT